MSRKQRVSKVNKPLQPITSQTRTLVLNEISISSCAVPKKLTLGFMMKTFFISMVDPTIGTSPQEKEKTEKGSRKMSGKRHKLGGIASDRAVDGVFTGTGPSYGVVCGPNGCS